MPGQVQAIPQFPQWILGTKEGLPHPVCCLSTLISKPQTKLIIWIQTHAFNCNFHQHYPHYCFEPTFIFVLTVTCTTIEILAVHGKELKVHMEFRKTLNNHKANVSLMTAHHK